MVVICNAVGRVGAWAVGRPTMHGFHLHCLHMIRIVLTLHSKVIYDNEVTCSVLDAVRFVFFVFFCTVCLMLLTAIEMSWADIIPSLFNSLA